MPKTNKPFALTALVAASFAVNLDTTIVNVALPALVRQLHATDTQLQWVVDAYNLVFAALVLVSGNLSDRWGRKGVLLGGLGVFAAAAAGGAMAASAGWLIAARALMGLGAAMIFPTTLSLIANVFTGRAERAQAVGAWGASAGAAIALGPVVGGWLLEHAGWSSVFWAMVPVATVAAWLVMLFVPTSRDPRATPLDRAGFLASTLAMALLVYTVIEAPQAGWASAKTLAGFGGAALALVAFVAWEAGAKAPMLDVRLFANRRFSAASASITLSQFTLFGFIFLITQFFQFVRNYPPLATGVRLLPVALSVGAASVMGTKLAVRFGTKQVVTAGLVLVTAFYAWVAFAIATTTTYAEIAAQMVLYGAGLGLVQAPATESIMGAVAKEKAGAGSAINDATRLVGGTLGVAVMGSVFVSLYTARLGKLAPPGLPRPLRNVADQSVGAAYALAARLASTGYGRLALALHSAASSSFVHAVETACAVAGAVAAAGALVAASALPAQPPNAPEAAEKGDGTPTGLELPALASETP